MSNLQATYLDWFYNFTDLAAFAEKYEVSETVARQLISDGRMQHNLQDIFNKVSMHLLNQGEASMSSDESCLYNGPEGKSCAVGCLVPPELRKDMEEFQDPENEVNARILHDSGILISDETFTLLKNLQTIHDEYLTCGVMEWAREMLELAEEFQLVPIPQLKETAGHE